MPRDLGLDLHKAYVHGCEFRPELPEGQRERHFRFPNATFCQYPKEHGRHLWTTNVVESAFAALRLGTDAAKRFKKVERATAVIWKMFMVAQQRFRRLNAPELLAKVYVGARYEDGVEVTEKEVAA